MDLGKYRPLRSALAALMVLGLASCYLPARFDAEITISRFGNYEMVFDGYMVQLELYNDLRQKKIGPDEEKQRAEVIRNDFTRDSATKSFEYYKQGRFKVRWAKSGDILQAPLVTFFRRNENMLSISYVKDSGQITVRATPIGPDRQQTLVNMGLNMQGQLRVRTDARVVSQNASRQETPQNPKMRGEKLYVWEIKSITDPPPTLSLFLQ